MSGLYPGSEIDPDARYAWDHDDPLEEDEDAPAVECNQSTVIYAEVIADPADTCPF